jgi:Mediator of RNA polymerase II transcription complex subunit 8
MASLSQDDIKALEQTRQRLLRLHTSLTALQQNVFEQQPLPSWFVL